MTYFLKSRKIKSYLFKKGENIMGLDKNRAFDVLKKISFERIAGTEKELECAHILEEECKKVGVDVVIEDFEKSLFTTSTYGVGL